MYYDYRQMQFPGFPPGQGGAGFPSFPPGGGGQGFPSYPPGGGQGFPGFPPTQPGGQGQGQQPPGPPPSFTPSQAQAQTLTTTSSQGATTFAVDPGAIQRCLFRYTFIWMRGGQSFWFYPTFVGRNSIAGFRWTGFSWFYFGTDLRRVRSFQCF
ncbi:transporter [Bacillus salacetis]|uniref:Transporter n=1 Tax=Bacillus salacetis TaxID=2315464 RepID=A0A3A1QWQ0_9BACI|nr:transporter [Bacillus salacetis]RIW29598.1 transporter [Bacillus salacetis]